ncbi:unnamed protein product, partial [Staurois parvus]
ALSLVKVLLNPGPCIHYIWSPTDPAFTISALPQYTEHRNAITTEHGTAKYLFSSAVRAVLWLLSVSSTALTKA